MSDIHEVGQADDAMLPHRPARANLFSKARIETLYNGIFAIAMTLLVLELKVPELARNAAPADILHALSEHALAFVGFVLTFILASQLLSQALIIAVSQWRRAPSAPGRTEPT